MYDHHSRFNPAASSTLARPTNPTVSVVADDNHNNSTASHQPSPPVRTPTTTTTATATATATPSISTTTTIPQSISPKTLRNLHRHASAHFARQRREPRAPTWLSEAQMLRQLKRVIWKVQTREEWLVVELEVVRSAVREMGRGFEAGVGMGTGKAGRERGRGIEGLVAREEKGQQKRWGREDRDIWEDGRAHLARWQWFIEKLFGTACEDVLRCREGVTLDEAHEVLDSVVSIRATADDRRWFEDLASLGELAGFGGLKILDARAKAVVWAIAEVYQAFKAEQRMTRQVGWAGGWVAVLVEAGEWLEECGLVSRIEPLRHLGGDSGVLSLCESFERMNLDGDEEEFHFKQAKRNDLKGKVKRVWQEVFGCLGTGFCTSS